MKKNILMGIIICLLVLLTTGCKRVVTKLDCTRTSDEGIEVYGELKTTMHTIFDDKGNRPKNSELEIVVDLNRTKDLTDEKIKVIVEKLKSSLCGDESYVKETDCNPTISGSKITFKTTGRFNDIMYTYTGEERIKDMQKFLEDHEKMTCEVSKGEDNA